VTVKLKSCSFASLFTLIEILVLPPIANGVVSCKGSQHQHVHQQNSNVDTATRQHGHTPQGQSAATARSKHPWSMRGNTRPRSATTKKRLDGRNTHHGVGGVLALEQRLVAQREPPLVPRAQLACNQERPEGKRKM
jgi:hypothetical protein